MGTTTIELLPMEFWMAVTALFFAGVYGVARIRHGIGLPLLAVVATVTIWYVGDIVYNGYADNHVRKFTPQILASAWMQVFGFTITLLVFSILLHKFINRDCAGNTSRMYTLYKNGVNNEGVQSTIDLFGKICVTIWVFLIGLAIANVGEKAVGFVLPFLGSPANAFHRGRIGSGPLSAFLALATNFHVLVAAGFGIVAALTRNSNIRFLALIGCLMTWPYFLLNRTRNTMLAACVPGILALIFIRLRAPMAVRIAVLVLAIFVGDTWLRFVMEARNSGKNVASYFFSHESADIVETTTKHAGLNMYEELCWLSHLMENKTYAPNMGRRYFAEIVNPIPRGLWPGKPMIGIEYAIARGQKWENASAGQAGVGATISTGMIGQGVDNFGPIFGPIASSFIMAMWVVVLARIDLHAQSLWRLPLYAIGLVLTFNCGRDVTLLVLYPFVFGYMVVRFIEYQRDLSVGKQNRRMV